MAHITQSFLLVAYVVGNFLTFLKKWDFLFFPVTNTGCWSVPAALQANRHGIILGILYTIAWILFKTQCLVLLHGGEKQPHLISIINVLRSVNIGSFQQRFFLHTSTVEESTLLHSSNMVLYTTVCCCLKPPVQP
jgi:hypothetical protein